MADELTRVAIIDADRCKPKKCRQECAKSCPVNRLGKKCIEAKPDSKQATISEVLCIGCGICVKKCPFEAIQIINLPKNLDKDTTHRYGPNSFKLHRLPTPRPNEVLGLVGTNGIGKSTALRILAGKLKPNLGRHGDPPDWREIVTYFRGSELQTFFTKLLEDKLQAVIKPQYVDAIPRAIKGTVDEVVSSKDKRGAMKALYDQLDLNVVHDRHIADLSGGELQRMALCVALCSDADIYMFDEPSSYLDVKQRLHAARAIRSLVGTKENLYIIVVEHDLAILDYLSDFICVLYGVPGIYGVVTLPFSVREGINVFLAGWIPTENLRFRDWAISFKVTDVIDQDDGERKHYLQKYPEMTKTQGNFKLQVTSGSFQESEIIVMLGENGTGKTTLIRMLAGKLPPDNGIEVPTLKVSYKPQKIAPTFPGTVRQLLTQKIQNAWQHPQFATDVSKPMKIEQILDQEVKSLSGGELQRLALVLALGTPADVYLIDEPSAYLDSEQRLVAGKCIKRFILHSKKTAFIVEHDLLLSQYLATAVIVYEGTPSVNATASAPMPLVQGMNKFLKNLGITFRRDPTNYRPRINKADSQQDREQKETGTYFFLDE